MTTIHRVWIPAHRVLRTAQQLVNRELRPVGITSAEGNILLHLMIQKAPAYQEQLVEELSIGKAAVSRAVDSLERKGYLSRARDASDKRLSLLSLTERAQEISETVQRAYDRMYQRVRQAIPDKDLDRLVALLDTVADLFSADE